ncbi:MAG TPA: 50S ribosomal protein L25 [Porphyromonadaceae bacterium]|nr:50S ribosomal protein L25 [Porphyromonadaceae bacterium]
MKSFELKGEPRKVFGKKDSKELRGKDLIPCVLYGGTKEENGGEGNVHFVVTREAVRKLIYSPLVQLVDVVVEDKKYKALVQEVQYHPVTDKIMHIDFYRIFENKPVVIEIPIVLEGLAQGVKMGGKLFQAIRKIKVRGLWKDFPQVLTINVENLGLGKSIMASDLKFDNLEVLTAKTVMVAIVKQTRAAKGGGAEGTAEGGAVPAK